MIFWRVNPQPSRFYLSRAADVDQCGAAEEEALHLAAKSGIRFKRLKSLGGYVIAGNHLPLTFYEVNYGNKQSGS